MDEVHPILTTQSVPEYFRDLLISAREHQKVEVAETTEFYLVNLLTHFLSTKAFRGPGGEEGSHEGEPLAFMLKRAQETTGIERARELKRLGDTSLYISGFFGDSLEKKLVDVDYYISMGGRAYDVLSRTPQTRSTAALYEELSAKFVKLVDLLSEIADRTAVGTNRGLVRLYERFLKTGSERMARLLSEQGVIPMPDPGVIQ